MQRSWNGHQWSSWLKPSCSKIALNRCTKTEISWNTKLATLSMPDWREILRPGLTESHEQVVDRTERLYSNWLKRTASIQVGDTWQTFNQLPALLLSLLLGLLRQRMNQPTDTQRVSASQIDREASTACVPVVGLFQSCDLDLDLMTFIYEPDLYCLEIHRMCKYELPTWSLSKVIVWQTDRQTYKQNWPKP